MTSGSQLAIVLVALIWYLPNISNSELVRPFAFAPQLVVGRCATTTTDSSGLDLLQHATAWPCRLVVAGREAFSPSVNKGAHAHAC